MKVVLVHGRFFNSWEALGLGYIGAYLRRHRPGIDIDFCQGCFDSEEQVYRIALNADIVGFSCTSPTFSWVVEVATKIKQSNPRVHVVIGGYHASALPHQCLAYSVIDQVVVGEGERVILDIVDGNREPVIYGNRVGFDELPWPDRSLIRAERNMEVARRDNGFRITSFQCHRACPFGCVYCADGRSKALYHRCSDKRPWNRDVEDTLDEIERTVDDYGIGQVKFCDPTWNIDVDWVIFFSRRKAERNIDVDFYPYIHARIVTQEMTDYMAAANCRKVAMGIESGSPKVLKQVGKGIDTSHIQHATNCFKKSGIAVRGFFILGMPCETHDDLEMTERFAAELDLDEYGFTMLCPYPGTWLYDEAMHGGIDWARTDEYTNDFWRTDAVSNAELHSWQVRLVDRFADRICWHNKVLAQT